MGFWNWLKRVVFNRFGNEIYNQYNSLQDRALEEAKDMIIDEVKKAMDSDRFNEILKECVINAVRRKRIKEAMITIVENVVTDVIEQVNVKMDEVVKEELEDMGIYVEEE